MPVLLFSALTNTRRIYVDKCKKAVYIKFILTLTCVNGNMTYPKTAKLNNNKFTECLRDLNVVALYNIII